MEESDYKRNSMSLKLNNKATDRISLDFSVRYTDTKINGGGLNDATSTLDTDKRLKYSVIYTPIPLENLDASAGGSDDELGNLYNPLVSISDNARKEYKSGSTWRAAPPLGGDRQPEAARSEVGMDHQDDGDQRYLGADHLLYPELPIGRQPGKAGHPPGEQGATGDEKHQYDQLRFQEVPW